ncbi:unnamed protein product [Nezara viridula]|uniref:C2H2-type domain-containing protein n=1 Tax=Nezara viridula TaxID=85310 RepID=A0A9P0MK32_NEZVI|nr:unnamed protein product [Nezara viridula]
MSLVTWDLWASMQPPLLKGSLNATGKLDTKRPDVLTWCDKGGGVDLAQSNVSTVGYYGNDGVECTKCGRHYKLKSSLRNHQKWECGKEPQFKCPYCNYRAKQKMHVARHIERMHREKLDMLELREQALKKGSEILP